MNGEQIGILFVALTATSTLGVSTVVFADIVQTPSERVGSGSAVFSENVQLEDDLNPASRDLSGVPFLQNLYDSENPDNESVNASNNVASERGDTSVVPVVIGIGLFFVVFLSAGVVWIWRLGNGSDSLEPIEYENTESSSSNSETKPISLNQLDIDKLTNDVYRSWYRMAQYTDPPSNRSLTPRELADLAVDKGLDQNAVEELTQEFESVRYGPREATLRREQRAKHALSEMNLENT